MHVYALRFASHHRTPSLTWVIGLGITFLLLVAIWSLSIISMWVYPAQRMAPLANINGIHIGGSGYQQAVTDLEAEELDSHPVTLVIGEETHQADLQTMGIEVDIEASVTKAIARQRQARDNIRPGEFWGPRSFPLVVEMDETAFEEFYENELAEYHGDPADARLVIANNKARIRPGETSWRIDKDALRRNILHSAEKLKDQVSIQVNRQQPEVTAEELRPLRVKAQRWLDRGITLKHENGTHPISPSRLGRWITIAKEDGSPELTVDRKQIRAHIKKLAKSINKEPEPVGRVLEDGEVVERQEGKPGRKVKVAESADAVVSALQSGDATAVLEIRTLNPGTRESHTYTATTRGMEALLANFASSYGGEYGLAVRTLNGDIRASYNGNKRFITASTYKMYLAFAAYTEIERGNLNSSRNIGPGKVGYCLKRMILYSTNPCAIALGDAIGWKRIDAILNEAGFHQTTLNNHKPGRINKYTTAKDAALFMQRLRAGELMNEFHTQRLLDHLRNQIYRSGIPAGSTGSVANKIGFLEGYLHDVGVVEGGGRDYVLAIYSYGGQWWQFKKLAQQVQSVLNQ